jgi:hypothetical protein
MCVTASECLEAVFSAGDSSLSQEVVDGMIIVQSVSTMNIRHNAQVIRIPIIMCSLHEVNAINDCHLEFSTNVK